jgi:REP element-mobilizing transposase RayT
MEQDSFEYGHIYHVYNRGYNGENIFREERNYVLFFSLMEKYLLPAADIYAYCLLKDHFHLLIRIKYEAEIADEKLRQKPYLALAHMLNSYTQNVNKLFNRKGGLFQEHLKRRRITDKDYLIRLVVYLHLSPAKYDFSDWRDYQYSSYREIISDQTTFLDRTVVSDYFGGRENFIYMHNLKKTMHEQIKL